MKRIGVRLLLRLADAWRGLLMLAFGAAGPRFAYAYSGLLARVLYRAATPLRQVSEAQCRAALAGRVPEERIPAIAEWGFVHRVWNLADLLLAPRWLLPTTLGRVGGRIPDPLLDELLCAQWRGRPAILLTAYYGPFDLLPLLLGYNGVRATAVYRRHANAAFDRLRTRVRALGGCTLITVDEALVEMPKLLDAGQTVALLADHEAPRRGIDETFLGLPTRIPRTVGILACRHNADVVVAGIRRVRRSFRFEAFCTDIIRPPDWRDAPDPVLYVTHRYLRALEALVLRDPEQYLWAYARWGAGDALPLSSGRPSPRSPPRGSG